MTSATTGQSVIDLQMLLQRVRLFLPSAIIAGGAVRDRLQRLRAKYPTFTVCNEEPLLSAVA